MQRQFQAIPASLEQIALFLSEAGVVHPRVLLVVNELVTNAILHGKAKILKIVIQKQKESLKIIISDDGIKFDITQNIFSLPIQIQENGYGLYVIQNLVDKINYSRENNWNFNEFQFTENHE